MDATGKKGAREDGRNLTRKPAREFKVGLSKDGKYWIFSDSTTWFVPTNYLSAILKNKDQRQNSVEVSPSVAEIKMPGGENDRTN